MRVYICFWLAAMAAPSQELASACEIAQDPARFDGKIVSVRSPIEIEFEHLALHLGEGCERRWRGGLIHGVWLEYGRGPKKQPTIWCCGDITPRDRLRLVQNDRFRAFHHYLIAQRRGNGCYEWDCYLYRVSATLTGRVDVSKGRGGFGHLGGFGILLVIQRAADIAIEPIRFNHEVNKPKQPFENK